MPCIGNVPIIVASGNIVKASGPVSATTIFTPAAAGVFRVSIYVAGPGNGLSQPINLTWTDISGAQAGHFGANQLNGNGQETIDPAASVSVVIEAEADAIQVSTSQVTGTGVGYTLYYVVEQLA